MNTWAWTILGFFVQITVGVCFEDRIGKGKIFTRPIQAVCIRCALRRLSIPKLYWVLPILALPASFRVLQLSIFWFTFLPACLLTGADQLTVLYWLVVIVLYLDDYITGDDDKWKKFKEGVKNKVKWLMDLPKQAPIPETQ